MNKDSKKVLLNNTVMLYILRFSTYFFGFVTVPYQTRVLGPTMYGLVTVAMSLMFYFMLMMDFGFVMSATRDISLVAEDKKQVSRIFSQVTAVKSILAILCVLIFMAIWGFVEFVHHHFLFFFIFLIGTIINGFVPDYVYRGIQDMKPVMLRVVISRAFFSGLIFLVLRSPDDYLWVPILSALGDTVGLSWSVWHMWRKKGIKLCRINLREITATFKLSMTFFLNRASSTLTTKFHLILLNLLYPGHPQVGMYGVCDKLITTGQSGIIPVSDSVYPYMVRNKDFKLIKKLLKTLMPIILLGSVFLWIFADEVCVIVFGSEYAGAGAYLRGMLPALALTLPEQLLGFPTMTALGLTKYANYSVYLTTAIHVVILLAVFIFFHINALILAYLFSLAVIVNVVIRVIVLYLYKKRLVSSRH